MAKLSRDDILKIAQLARLRLTEESIAHYQQDLENILAYVEQLQAIDTTDVEPTVQVTDLKNVMREDEIIDYDTTSKELLAAAPERIDDSFAVKRVLS